jgi:hypothetical protein
MYITKPLNVHNEATQCTICVILRRVREPLLLWRNNIYYIFSVRVCSLSYPACRAHAPCYTVNCTPSQAAASNLLFAQRTIFEKLNFIQHKASFQFLYKFCPQHFSFFAELSAILSAQMCACLSVCLSVGLYVQHQLFLSEFNQN